MATLSLLTKAMRQRRFKRLDTYRRLAALTSLLSVEDDRDEMGLWEMFIQRNKLREESMFGKLYLDVQADAVRHQV